ncbi:MAG TPA: error-prone DNA polymerase [Polyangiales bacterium]|nr:error-prone DNA polymerase [Polyangiales bacterium]
MTRACVPLWCKSNFSFLEGASHPEELMEEAQRLGFSSLAITDRDGVYGVVRAHVKARELGMHLIVGSELTLDDGSTLLVLVRDRAGYANLCRLVTRGRLRHEKGSCSVSWDEVCEHAPGLIALWGGARSLLVDPTRFRPELANRLREAFGDGLYALLARHKHWSEPPAELLLRERAARHGLPLVAAHEVLYHMRVRRQLQDVLTCIRHGTTLGEAHTRLKPNAEHELKSPHALAQLFADEPAALARSAEIAERCTFALDQLRYRYPSERLPDGASSIEWLRTLAFQGARGRYAGELPADVEAQLQRELEVIEKLDYAGYFLTMWEIVEFCRKQGILCQGRGSAANSAVCYCLGVTAVDPVRMGFLFERFLSMERAEPPDIDLDIEHERREEVIQHVYAKYGRSHAAMVANVIRYRSRSAVRDVGKALGLPETGLDRFAKLISHWDRADPDTARVAGFELDVPLHAHLMELSEEILDFPRHLSIHPGGFLLGHEPVSDLVPIENGAMADRTVIQWDKDDVEAIGLFKVDLLGLGALTQMHMCFDMLKERRGIELSMAEIPAQDEPTFEMIRQADTVGVFQIESRAQMSMLPRLLPKNFYDLVVEVSIVRPGPITGGMVHPYLRRRNGQEPVEYPHACLKPVLEKTLGVPLFQEQVMKLAIVAADYTPGESDQLRRDMAAWRKTGRIESHRERLLTRMQSKGISAEFAERVFKQILGFGEYGFPESHAASFALIAYATAYLRTHYPAEFCCSLLNAQPMGFYSPATIIDDAKRHGVVVRPIDAVYSAWDCTLEDLGPGELAVRIGLRYAKGLGKIDGACIEEARKTGPFESLPDFVRRTGLSSKALSILAEAGAFECFVPARRRALWEVRGLLREREATLQVTSSMRAARFAGLTPIEQIAWDYRTSSHSTRSHPLALMRRQLTQKGLPDARSLARLNDGARVRYAGLVICRQRPGTASGVTFMTLEDETGFANLVLWKRVFDSHNLLARTASFMGVTGKLQKQDGVVHIVVEEVWQPELPAPTEVGSRDFH